MYWSKPGRFGHVCILLFLSEQNDHLACVSVLFLVLPPEHGAAVFGHDGAGMRGQHLQSTTRPLTIH
jgi:hypothetical protein